MRNILALVGAAVVLFAVLGWYLKWYEPHVEPSADGHFKFNVDVNKKKIVEDGANGVQKVTGLISNESKGTTPTPEKKVEGKTTGYIQFNSDGTQSIILPKIEVKTGK